MSHVRWAATSAVTVLDLAAGSLGRLRLPPEVGNQEYSLADYFGDRGWERRAALTPAGRRWIETTHSAHAEYQTIVRVRKPFTHGLLRQPVSVAVGISNPHQGNRRWRSGERASRPIPRKTEPLMPRPPWARPAGPLPVLGEHRRGGRRPRNELRGRESRVRQEYASHRRERRERRPEGGGSSDPGARRGGHARRDGRAGDGICCLTVAATFISASHRSFFLKETSTGGSVPNATRSGDGTTSASGGKKRSSGSPQLD